MSLSLTVAPATALIDVPRRITLRGATPGAQVVLSTQTLRAGHVWLSRAVFRADAQGVVDLNRDAPLGGDYQGVQPMGLIWSQICPTGGAKDHAQFNATMAEPLVTRITATCGGDEVQADLIQTLIAPGVTREEIREDGVVGVLYRPPGDGPHPAVMFLNGSNGGVNEPRAALMAARGYVALTLAYFGYPGVPRYISNTPLEYFADALDWLRAKVRPKGGFVAVSGQSRGGELALLLGATFPDKVSAVAGWVPSAFVHGGQAASDPAFGRDGPSWTQGGAPLTHIWQENRAASWAPYDAGAAPRRNSKAMVTALADPQATARARIPVERIAGPVLLISGGDDGAWPSDIYALLVSSSLAAAGHQHEVRWENWPEAGHSILFPYVPTTRIASVHPVSGVMTTNGGTPAANAVANEGAWAAMCEWLDRASGKVPSTGVR
ncbi:acyl-CoA thioesterase/bile acid-CoA:amino acid N-acyltransferase family protein [Paenirhodobacter sp.]|uniref:acyl-CoA thioesterase/bile acid-CoA:amino acid N-acyltransferase family protein n=1 Tax=Paenirhodobacter sp. TaxID=1965326 RepID=UPI003B3FEEC2